MLYTCIYEKSTRMCLRIYVCKQTYMQIFKPSEVQQSYRAGVTLRSATAFNWHLLLLPRGSEYPTFKVSGPKNPYPSWFLRPESSNIGYLGSLGYSYGNMRSSTSLPSGQGACRSPRIAGALLLKKSSYVGRISGGPVSIRSQTWESNKEMRKKQVPSKGALGRLQTLHLHPPKSKDVAQY